MHTIKVLVIPADTATPAHEAYLSYEDEGELDNAMSWLILGHGDGPVGAAGFGPTMLFFDEIAGDRINPEATINPRANELWNYLAAGRGSALSYADEEPLYGTFLAVGHGTGSVTDDGSLTDVSTEIRHFPFTNA